MAKFVDSMTLSVCGYILSEYLHVYPWQLWRCKYDWRKKNKQICLSSLNKIPESSFILTFVNGSEFLISVKPHKQPVKYNPVK